MVPSVGGKWAWYAAMSASVISVAQKRSKWCSARGPPCGGRISGWASSSPCHQPVPEPSAPTPMKSGADGTGTDVGEVGPQGDVDLRRQLGEPGDLRLERRAERLHHVVPQGRLLGGLRRPALLLEALVDVLGVDAEERQRPAVLRGGVGDALLVLQDQDPVGGVGREHALELR